MNAPSVDTKDPPFRTAQTLGIATTTVRCPAHRTVEEGKALRGAMSGQSTKNLLLKDKKGTLFMIVADEDRPIDLRRLHVHIGGQGRTRLRRRRADARAAAGRARRAHAVLLLHDTEMRVRPVIDASLMQAAQLNFHPLVNTESTGIALQALLDFMTFCGHAPLIADFDPMAAADAEAAASPPPA